METELEISNKLSKLQGWQQPILTVYLSHEGTQPPKSGWLTTQFNSLLHQMSKPERRQYKTEIAWVDNYLHGYDGGSVRSFAFFASGKDLHEVLEFEFILPSLISTGRAVVEPIQQALENYTKYLVILADREKARMFKVELGKITEHAEFTDGHVPQRVKAIRHEGVTGKDDKIFRHIEQHLHQHLQLVSDAAKKFARSNNIHFVIIGGHREMFEKIKEHLPKPLAKKVVAEFVTELDISPADVLLMTKPLAAEIKLWPVNKRPAV